MLNHGYYRNSQYTIENVEGKARLEQVNIYSNKFNGALFDYRTYATKCSIKPRAPYKTYVDKEIVKERRDWSFPISIFREYKVDTEVHS